jgi:hypothetical protein
MKKTNEFVKPELGYTILIMAMMAGREPKTRIKPKIGPNGCIM